VSHHRSTWRGVTHLYAHCEGCGWQTTARKNGVALAAQHYDRCGAGPVNVEVVWSITFRAVGETPPP